MALTGPSNQAFGTIRIKHKQNRTLYHVAYTKICGGEASFEFAQHLYKSPGMPADGAHVFFTVENNRVRFVRSADVAVVDSTRSAPDIARDRVRPHAGWPEGARFPQLYQPDIDQVRNGGVAAPNVGATFSAADGIVCVDVLTKSLLANHIDDLVAVLSIVNGDPQWKGNNRTYAVPMTQFALTQNGGQPFPHVYEGKLDLHRAKGDGLLPRMCDDVRDAADVWGDDTRLRTASLRLSTNVGFFPDSTSRGMEAWGNFGWTHHCREGWRWQYGAEAKKWVQVHMPHVWTLHTTAFAALCGTTGPEYHTFCIFMHVEQERIDTYSWSIVHQRQLCVNFERWYGEEDGYGEDPRSRRRPD